MSSQRLFLTVVAGTLVGLSIWRVVEEAEGSGGWPRTIATAVGIFVAVNLIAGLRQWVQGRRGLGQWPEPHGRYYDEWLSLPSGAGDYYEWLAQRMGNREPWATWVQRERALHSDTDAE